MPIPRSVLVDRTVSGLYHCISRCVRRAFLCGDGFDHRRDWIQNRTRELSKIFAIDVGAYAVLSNHFHVVLRNAPERAGSWSARDVVARWARVHPASIREWAEAAPAKSGPRREPLSDADAIALLARDDACVAMLRDRLSDLSWFMRELKEPLARLANREDEVTGCFWEGRFRSPRLLDDAATLAGMVYVDLNVIRAHLAETPEQSDHTSVQDRIHVRQLFEKRSGRRKRAPRRAVTLVDGAKKTRTAEDGIWLAPIDRRADERGLLPLTLDEYLTLVDATGRLARSGKRGTIPAGLPPLLERLQIDASAWFATLTRAQRLFGSTVGGRASRAAEALRRGRERVVGALQVHA
jgi:hypothetical protein